jgi:hypothetical protein
MVIFSVEANFEGFEARHKCHTGDSWYQKSLGVFDSLELAQFNKDKWEKFYKTKKEEIFTKYSLPEYRDEDGDILDEYENDYYVNQSIYADVYYFQDIWINKFELNAPNLPLVDLNDSHEGYNHVITQWNTEWERDYKINNLLK